MNAARVYPFGEPAPHLPHLTVDIGCRWSPQHMVIHDRSTGYYAERNPLMTDGGLIVQSALLRKQRASWLSRLFSKFTKKETP